NADGTSTSTISGPVIAEEKAQKKNNVKARSMLLMALPNEHLLTFKYSCGCLENKPDLETMSFDDLYINFKIIEQEVKRTVFLSSRSGSLNMAFLSSPSSTNEVDTASIQVTITGPDIVEVEVPSAFDVIIGTGLKELPFSMTSHRA
nr:hypothetical protein [Tanacetum cinerariifolium]